MKKDSIKFVFFGSSNFSIYVLEKLKGILGKPTSHSVLKDGERYTYVVFSAGENWWQDINFNYFRGRLELYLLIVGSILIPPLLEWIITSI